MTNQPRMAPEAAPADGVPEQPTAPTVAAKIEEPPAHAAPMTEPKDS